MPAHDKERGVSFHRGIRKQRLDGRFYPDIHDCGKISSHFAFGMPAHGYQGSLERMNGSLMAAQVRVMKKPPRADSARTEMVMRTGTSF